MILKGDCIEVMKAIKPNSVDAIVCDPPYGLEFMGKEWDKLEPNRSVYRGKERNLIPEMSMPGTGFKRLPQLQQNRNFKCRKCGKYKWGHKTGDGGGGGKGCECENPEFVVRHYGNEQQAFHQEWLTEAYKVLKPGGSMLVMGGTRIGYDSPADKEEQADKNPHTIHADNEIYGDYSMCKEPWKQPKGRFPANVILSHHPECVQVGMKKVKGNERPNFNGTVHPAKGNVYGKYKTKSYNLAACDLNGLETVEFWDCHPDCAVFILDQQSGVSKSSGGLTKSFAVNHRVYGKPGVDKLRENAGGLGDSGGASRFFYCAKSSRGERNAGLDGMEERNQRYQDGRGNSHECFEMEGCGRKTKTVNKNNHPTVKPIKLFEYLIKLVTREGQIILDPFIGSGTTAIAAHNVGRKCVGIEKEDEYLTIAKRRIDYWKNQSKQMEMGI